MKIAILPSAHDDLAAGFGFYERQREGLGSISESASFLILSRSSFMQESI